MLIKVNNSVINEIFWLLIQNLMNFILEKLILVKNPYFMDFDLETSRVYAENKGKNQL